MRLHRICFKNFGIIRDQIMEDIHPGLVIIAGPNRAGKTTLMTALRYLGYGLPKKDLIPFSTAGQHDYNADVELPDQSRYNIHILGNSRPKVSPLNSQQNMEIEEIFNDLDGFTYRQVFTISLDELRRVPEGLGTKEEKYLQIVLLGGGWVDALRLVKFKEEFNKRAYDIGRSKGTKSVGEFKTYTEKIKEGISERNDANKQLDSYYVKKQELTELETETIPQIENDLENLQTKLETLEIIRDHYNKYEKMLLLGEKLKQSDDLLNSYPEDGFNRGTILKKEFDVCVDEYGNALRKYSDATGMESTNIFTEKEDVLLKYQRDLSGWKEKVAGYQENKQSLIDEEKALKQKLIRLNAKWRDDLSVLDNITTDHVNKENLREIVDTHKKIGEKIERISFDKIQAKSNLVKKQEEKKQFTKKDRKRPKNLPVIIGLGLALVLLIAILNPIVSLAAGFVLAASIYIYFQSFQLKDREFKNQLVLIEKEIEGFREQLTSLESEEKSLQESLDASKNKIDQTVKLLNLPENTPYHQLTDFYGEIINLKERYVLRKENKEKLETQHGELKKIFDGVISLLGSLNQDISDIDDDFSVSEKIFTAVEEVIKYLKLAQELEKADKYKKELEKKITALLQNEKPGLQIPLEIIPTELSKMLDSFIDRGGRYQELKKEREIYENLNLDLETSLNMEKRRKILLKNESEEDILSAYKQHFNAYSSLTKIERKYDDITGDIDGLKLQRDSKLENKAVLKTKIRVLSSDEKLQDAHQKIIGAKNKLENLAEQYATYRLAEFMVDAVHKTFIENTKGTIIGTAGDIFKKITSGDYEEIDIPGAQCEADFNLNFKVKQKDGKDLMPVHQLSRATKEQLFLSMRLSRIRNIKPLPIIFDDSLVNFDPKHSRQTARLIIEMAKTHQVFVLTCHPKFIDHLQAQTQSAQYWGLDNGRISGPFDAFDEVINLLDPEENRSSPADAYS